MPHALCFANKHSLHPLSWVCLLADFDTSALSNSSSYSFVRALTCVVEGDSLELLTRRSRPRCSSPQQQQQSM
jgi:hypothetical protein